jgi:GGDEF domain-containing protein
MMVLSKRRHAMNILCISNDPSLFQSRTGDGITLSVVSGSHSLEGLTERPDAIVISTGSTVQDEAVLGTFRKTPGLCLVPVFLSQPATRYFNSLYDGIFTTFPELVNTSAEIHQRLSEMNYGDMMGSQDYRLLAFLVSRNADLLPFEDPLSPQVYRYPVAEMLGDPETGAFDWVVRLAERGLIVAEELIDRIRLCPKCEWSHLNFVDICPFCQSLQFLKVPFIHCFTCGHVAPQEKFLAEGIMQCPNCRAKLRHIGSDYDRPMEDYFCSTCNQSFIDPQIIARCMNCGQKNSTDSLISRPVHSYRVSSKGVSSAKIGRIDDIFALLDNLNYVNPVYFNMLLSWLLHLARRYPGDAFSIIGITIKNTIELTERLGKHDVLKLIDAFAGRLRQLIRTTDITTRTSERTLWILLPKTPSSGCQVLAQKIMSLQELTKQPDGSVLEYGKITFTGPDQVLEGETAELLLARLATSMED